MIEFIYLFIQSFIIYYINYQGRFSPLGKLGSCLGPPILGAANFAKYKHRNKYLLNKTQWTISILV